MGFDVFVENFDGVVGVHELLGSSPVDSRLGLVFLHLGVGGRELGVHENLDSILEHFFFDLFKGAFGQREGFEDLGRSFYLSIKSLVGFLAFLYQLFRGGLLLLPVD